MTGLNVSGRYSTSAMTYGVTEFEVRRGDGAGSMDVRRRTLRSPSSTNWIWSARARQSEDGTFTSVHLHPTFLPSSVKADQSAREEATRLSSFATPPPQSTVPMSGPPRPPENKTRPRFPSLVDRIGPLGLLPLSLRAVTSIPVSRRGEGGREGGDTRSWP